VNSRRVISQLLAITSSLMLVSFDGCTTMKPLFSTWRTDSITIDGNSADWSSVPTYVGKENVSVALRNDDQSFFLCLAVYDPQLQKRILQSGFTVWFDRDGGSKKNFGVKFPIGQQPGGERPSEGGLGGQQEMHQPSLANSLFEMEIVGSEPDDRFRLPVVNTAGIQAKIAISDRSGLVYELQIPLTASPMHPYAIGATAGSHVGVGFELATTQGLSGLGRPGGGGPPGGMGDGGLLSGGEPSGQGGPPSGGSSLGGQGGPPGGGMRGQDGPSRGGRQSGSGSGDQDVNMWFKVLLSAHQ
jgi:hypothetical protein